MSLKGWQGIHPREPVLKESFNNLAYGYIQVPRQHLVNTKSLGEGLSQRTPCTWKGLLLTYFQDEPYIKKSLYHKQTRTYTKNEFLQNQGPTAKNTGFWHRHDRLESRLERTICTNKTIQRGVHAGTRTVQEKIVNTKHPSKHWVKLLGPMVESNTAL